MKVLLFDKDSKADPTSVPVKYARMLVKANPKKWAIVEEETTAKKEVKQPIEVVEQPTEVKPKTTRRRRTKKTE